MIRLKIPESILVDITEKHRIGTNKIIKAKVTKIEYCESSNKYYFRKKKNNIDLDKKYVELLEEMKLVKIIGTDVIFNDITEFTVLPLDNAFKIFEEAFGAVYRYEFRKCIKLSEAISVYYKFLRSNSGYTDATKRARRQELHRVFRPFSDIFDYNSLMQLADSSGYGNSENLKIIIKRLNQKTDHFSLNEFLNLVFDYNVFSKKENSANWTKHDLFLSLNVGVCPYCNRQYITVYEDKYTTAHADHYYPKSKYAFLGLSLYNLIPSCSICNSIFKGESDPYVDEMIYPYKNSFVNYDGAEDFAAFTINSNDLNYIMESSDNFELDLKINCEDMGSIIRQSCKVFKLNEIYKIHKGYILSLLKKHMFYDENKIYDLFMTYPNMFSSIDDVYEQLFDNLVSRSEYINQPLSKLTRDILAEHGLYKE